MKTVLMWFMMLGCTLATPDFAQTTSESLLGANDTSYALVRVVFDNQGSHYSNREKTYLDEYNQETGKLFKSTLLLDIIYSIDVSHSDPNSRPTITPMLQSKDTTLIWAHVMEKYNVSYVPQDDSYWMKRITYKEGALYVGARIALDKDALDSIHSSHGQSPHPPELSDVELAGGCFFLSFRQYEQDDHYNTTILRVSPLITRRIQNWMSIEENYLLISSHKTLKEANTTALTLHQGPTPAIWSHTENGQTSYKVVYQYVKANEHNRKRYSTNPDHPLTIIPSTHFMDCWYANKHLK